MHPTRSTATVFACLAALALLVSGCGGSTDPGVAKLGTTTASSTSTTAGSEAPGGGLGVVLGRQRQRRRQ